MTVCDVGDDRDMRWMEFEERQPRLAELGRRAKVADLDRDARILVHSIVTNRDGLGGEYKLRGAAIAEPDRHVQDDYATVVAAQLGWKPEPGRFHLFRVDVADVTFIRWDNTHNDQYVTRWPEGREFVRRGTSDTSLGDPEPMHELLA